MSTEPKLSHKVISALVYLNSILEMHEGQEIIISITKDRCAISRTSEELLAPKILTAEEYYINPIKDMLEHINEEMCTDCLKFDSYFKDDFFSSLVRAYVDSLVHEYGLSVPITPELAIAIVQHDISAYDVVYKPLIITHVLQPGISSLRKDSYRSLGQLKNYMFYLKAK